MDVCGFMCGWLKDVVTTSKKLLSSRSASSGSSLSSKFDMTPIGTFNVRSFSSVGRTSSYTVQASGRAKCAYRSRVKRSLSSALTATSERVITLSMSSRHHGKADAVVPSDPKLGRRRDWRLNSDGKFDVSAAPNAARRDEEND